ncbi:MAG: hypothetical protein E5W55_01570 [Mesorhizobium sp.]|nr:MAG: hypothetical protein E5W55_01570 [Mesorhizobium sp.]
MTRPSNSLDDLQSDIAHLSTLINVITDKALDICNPDMSEGTRSELKDVTGLLWIARDLAEQITANAEACQRRIIEDRRGLTGETHSAMN